MKTSQITKLYINHFIDFPTKPHAKFDVVSKKASVRRHIMVRNGGAGVLRQKLEYQIERIGIVFLYSLNTD